MLASSMSLINLAIFILVFSRESQHNKNKYMEQLMKTWHAPFLLALKKEGYCLSLKMAKGSKLI